MAGDASGMATRASLAHRVRSLSDSSRFDAAWLHLWLFQSIAANKAHIHIPRICAVIATMPPTPFGVGPCGATLPNHRHSNRLKLRVN
jgi:hypothetical protein